MAEKKTRTELQARTCNIQDEPPGVECVATRKPQGGQDGGDGVGHQVHDGQGRGGCAEGGDCGKGDGRQP